MPTPLTDADKVLRNDTGKDIVDKLDDIATAIAQGGGGGGASTVSQLTDVLLSATIPDGDVLIRDNNLTGGKLWKNKTITVELTQAEYDELENPESDVNYYITDAPSMQGTSADLSYDGTTKSTYTKIEEVVDYIDSGLSGKQSKIKQETLNLTTTSQGLVNIGKSTTNGEYVLSVTAVTTYGGYYCTLSLTTSGDWYANVKQTSDNSSVNSTAVAIKVVWCEI